MHVVLPLKNILVAMDTYKQKLAFLQNKSLHGGLNMNYVMELKSLHIVLIV
jgi:hypothetical protein